MKKLSIIACMLISMISCNNNGKKSDAYGNFEAVETIISAQASGELLLFSIEEGREISREKQVGLIDTTQLYLKKMQLMAQRQAVAGKVDNILSQIDVYQEQKQNLLVEKQRVKKLLKDGAVPPKQLDNIKGQLDVIDKQIRSVRVQNSNILSEVNAIDLQIRQIEDQLQKCTITNPVKGTVLTKYAEPHELTATGKPLYKIANLETVYLKVYVSGAQLPGIKIGQKVTVLFDRDAETNQSTTGEICWISEQAEFTPKIIQTKQERVDLVYAVKIRVKNSGAIKIGMPGEVLFESKT